LITRPKCNAPVLGWRDVLFSFDGRIGRSTYWRFLGPYIAVYLVLALIDAFAHTPTTKVGGLFSSLFWVAALYPSIAVAVKRGHDRDHSWWFLLLGLVPIANLVLLVELAFMPGAAGPNRYGLPEAGALVGELVAPVTSETSVQRCPACSTPYRRTDYRSDAPHIYCSACKAKLPVVAGD
jgi:uncharacterized membrane protein YhaH (DUF805 family)